MKGVDNTLFRTIAFLVVFGLLILASASLGYSVKRFGYPYYYLFHQLAFGIGVGGLLFALGLRIPVSLYKRFAPLILVASMGLLLLIFVPGIGFSTGGATRWLHIGPISFQPSEFLKFAMVVYLAAWMHSKRKEVASFTLGFLPFLLITGFVSIFLYKEPDIGTLGVIALTSLGMFILAGGRGSQIALAVLLGAGLLIAIIYAEPYRRARLFVFLNPELESTGIGYHVDQARIAIGSGGLFGRGLGLSQQKYSFLPEPMGDAIFAVFAEEFGFIGVSVVLAAFIFFFFRGMLMAARAYDSFAQLLAAGITLLVITQVIVNIGSLSGLMPLTGIPLPFISYGGSALALTLAEVGIILNVSKTKI